MFHDIEHIFFDLDHTLWDFDKNSSLTFKQIFEEEKFDIDLTSFLEAYIPINLKYWELYRNDSITKEKLRLGRLEDSFNLMKIKVDSTLLDTFSNKYIDYLPNHNYLLDGTLDILNYLEPKYQLHIITNGFNEVQARKMKTSGIDHFFKTIMTSEEAGVKKPHSLIFEKALLNSNANPKNSMMIGDNYEADILGAQNFGLSTIFFDYYNNADVAAQVQIKTLKELRNYL